MKVFVIRILLTVVAFVILFLSARRNFIPGLLIFFSILGVAAFDPDRTVD
jgi:hypothetical protein